MAEVKTASARWIEGMEFETETGSGHRSSVDAGKGSGGKNHGPSPMELLLVGLAGCTGMDVIDLLRKKRLEVSGLQVLVEGTRAETHPMVYTALQVVYKIRGKGIPDHAVEQAIRLSADKYCGAGAMLRKTAKLESRYEIVEE